MLGTVDLFGIGFLCIEVCFGAVALIASAVPAYLFISKFFSVSMSVCLFISLFSSSTTLYSLQLLLCAQSF